MNYKAKKVQRKKTYKHNCPYFCSQDSRIVECPWTRHSKSGSLLGNHNFRDRYFCLTTKWKRYETVAGQSFPNSLFLSWKQLLIKMVLIRIYTAFSLLWHEASGRQEKQHLFWTASEPDQDIVSIHRFDSSQCFRYDMKQRLKNHQFHGQVLFSSKLPAAMTTLL